MTGYSPLVALLADRSAKLGEFTLASGKKSNFYIDARLTTMSPDGLKLIGPLALSAIINAQWKIDAVGGLTLGADPISYAISLASASSPHPLRAFTVRKEAKTHGTAKLIEGPLYNGDRVAIIEDVITTGDSALRAIAAVHDANVIVVGVLALIDREEGGRSAIERTGVPVLTLVSAAEILSARESQQRSSTRTGL
jgi:orotate phosphoribosyltransferase